MELLERVRTIPGNECLTLGRLNNWFIRHRSSGLATKERWSYKDTPTPVENSLPGMLPHMRLVDDDSICAYPLRVCVSATVADGLGTMRRVVFPKLTPMQLQQLQVLYRHRPEPADGVITFWATRLHADREEVAAWIQYQQEKAKKPAPRPVETTSVTIPESGPSSSPTESPSAQIHLPTPTKSPSPIRSPQMRMHSLPPIAVKVEESDEGFSSNPVSYSASPVMLHPSVSFPEPGPVDRLMHLPSVGGKVVDTIHHESHDLCRGHAAIGQGPTQEPTQEPKQMPRTMDPLLTRSLRDALEAPSSKGCERPSTVSEFVASFGPCKERIKRFLRLLESGQLKQVGWDPGQCIRRLALHITDC